MSTSHSAPVSNTSRPSRKHRIGRKILLGLFVLLVIFVVLVAMQPKQFRVTRSAVIAAPPAVVFAKVNDLHQWALWSPWERRDLNMKKTFEGPAVGTGAIYAWDGNAEVGAGRMTIVESRPDELVSLKVTFLRPFEATNAIAFTFKPEAAGTQVTWDMVGDNNFLSKAMQLFMDMDAMVGKDFEEGLASLKTVTESVAASAPASQPR